MARRLVRSNRHRLLLGVAGGMARFFQVDPALVRLGWVVACLLGFGLAVYFIAALILPPRLGRRETALCVAGLLVTLILFGPPGRLAGPTPAYTNALVLLGLVALAGVVIWVLVSRTR